MLGWVTFGLWVGLGVYDLCKKDGPTRTDYAFCYAMLMASLYLYAIGR